MKKYLVTASYVVVCKLEIEAEYEEQSWEKAHDADKKQFTYVSEGDWEIDDVVEITE